MTHLELALCTGGMILGTFLPRVLWSVPACTKVTV